MKLLSKDKSEPVDSRGRPFPHRQSFAEWRVFLNDLMTAESWSTIPDWEQVMKPGFAAVTPPLPDTYGPGTVTERVRHSEVRPTSKAPREGGKCDQELRRKQSTPVFRERYFRRSDSSSSSSSESSDSRCSSDRQHSGEGIRSGSGSQVNALVSALQSLRFPREVIPPPDFDPETSESMRKFLVTYEKYFNSKYDANEYEKSAHLARFLLGTASRAYDALNGRSVKFSKLKPKLISWFDTEKTSARDRCLREFSATSMLPGDTLGVYCSNSTKLPRHKFLRSWTQLVVPSVFLVKQRCPGNILNGLQKARIGEGRKKKPSESLVRQT